MNIRITKEVRALIVELDGLHEKKLQITRELADTSINHSHAVDLGFDRQAITAQILGCAWRITQAARPLRR